MKKALVFIILVGVSLALPAQNLVRELIPGQIKVDRGNDPSAINVFNLSTGQYTYTDNYGQFRMAVKEGDELVFSSMRYQQFTVIITESILEKRKIEVNLRRGLNRLEEVVIKPELTGDISVDVGKLETKEANIPKFDVQNLLRGYNYNFKPDRLSTVESSPIDKKFLRHGLNFANIFKTLFVHKKRKNKTEHEKADLKKEIQKTYESDFFKDYLDIDKGELDEFLNYAEAEGLTYTMLKKGNELELIDFLIDKSKAFKEQKK